MQSYVKGSFSKALLESSNIFANFKDIKFYKEINIIKDDEKCTRNIVPGVDLMHKCQYHSDFVVKIKLLKKKDIQIALIKHILDFQLIA